MILEIGCVKTQNQAAKDIVVGLSLRQNQICVLQVVINLRLFCRLVFG